MGPDGRPVTYQADEFGQQVGQGIGQWKAPMMQDFGGYKGAVDPVSLGVRPVGANTPSPESMMTDARAREANANKPMTEVQSNALLFGTRMKQADQILGKLASEGTVKPTMGALSSTGIGTALSSGPQQQMQQAQTDFMTAILRKESGAAISQGEFDTARRQYFPQLGDSPEVIQQKAQNRALAIQGVLAGAPEQHRNDLQAATGNSTKMLSRAEYDSLPSGSLYTAPDGKQRIKK
jgi:hypothetical protein